MDASFFAADASGQHSAPGGPAFFAYSTNYLIDVEHGIDVEATPANRSMEVRSAERMIYRVVAQDRAKRG